MFKGADEAIGFTLVVVVPHPKVLAALWPPKKVLLALIPITICPYVRLGWVRPQISWRISQFQTQCFFQRKEFLWVPSHFV